MKHASAKIINILQDESSYNEQSGTFVFQLSEEVDDEWKNIFASLIGDGYNSFYAKPRPTFKRNDAISALANIEGEGDIPTTTTELQHLIRATNVSYNEMVDERVKKDKENKKKKLDLDNKVKQIIGKLDL
ncbi:hypothetical protein [Kosakonia pseudosacchari]|uniref:hypothetical protein n=1 Tax=Kosakonia pseudosacchari TaxID=1646340 RepID=UPI00187F312B|nr:hypothetical protein [Kosakonia pseudosacchari]QOV65815.1 hypothetical protein IP581_09300 [Kosakonia pseudosacchari]